MILSTLSLTFLPYSRFLSLSVCVCVSSYMCVHSGLWRGEGYGLEKKEGCFDN